VDADRVDLRRGYLSDRPRPGDPSRPGLLGAMGHRSKKRWLGSPKPREGLCIVPIGLTIALADKLDTPSIRDNNFMAALSQQTTEPRRVRASFEDDAIPCAAPDTIGDRLPSRSDLELL
jgi:hypothetical protein